MGCSKRLIIKSQRIREESVEKLVTPYLASKITFKYPLFRVFGEDITQGMSLCWCYY